MRKIGIILLVCMLLCGCAAAPTFETLGDIPHEQGEAGAPLRIQLQLPPDALRYEDSYFCNGYYLELQTMRTDDLSQTVLSMCGFSREDLTLMTASAGDLQRYEWVWSAVSEEGELICRAAIIADGDHHYCLTAVAPADSGGSLTEEWNRLFSSFVVS